MDYELMNEIADNDATEFAEIEDELEAEIRAEEEAERQAYFEECERNSHIRDYQWDDEEFTDSDYCNY